MRNNFFNAVIISILGTIPGIASAEPSAEILEFGYYEVLGEGQNFEDRSTPSGITQAGPTVKLIQQTDVIPIELNRLFGFRFQLKGFAGKEDIELREVVTHPRIARPGQKGSTSFETKLGVIIRGGELTDYIGYNLNHDYEMVAGEWRFELWYEDKKLLEQKFKTVKD